MDPYTVIARRYRPQTFDEVVGQEAIATTLKNAIREDRIAHAFLFSGSRGVGKTSMARILAKALNCAKGPTPDPCDACEICQAITDCSDPDVVEIDAASNTGVDDVRTLRDNVRYAPLRGRYKVYIIDEAHMLSKGAWNAFLKTLEEPPPHAKFIFATTEAIKVPETIRSRCQQFEFRRITTKDIAARLKQVCKKEKVKCDEDVLHAVARAGQGSMRDAQSILDQAIAYASGAPTLELLWDVLGNVPQAKVLEIVDQVVHSDFQALVLAADDLLARGREPGIFLDQLVDHFRQLLLLATCGRDFPLLELDPEDKGRCEAAAKAFGVDALTTAIQMLGESRRRLRDVTNPRVLLELTLIKLCRVRDLVEVGALVERLERVAHAESPAVPAAPAPERAATPTRAVSAPPPPPKPRVASAAPPAPARPAPIPAPDEPDDEPAEALSAVVPVGELTLERIRGLWTKIIDATRAKSMPVSAYAREAQPTRLEGRELTVGFASSFPFHKTNMERPDSRAVLESALEAVTGVQLHVHVVSTGGASAPAPAGASPSSAQPDAPASPRRSKSQEATQEPMVRKAMDVFDARIINVEE